MGLHNCTLYVNVTEKDAGTWTCKEGSGVVTLEYQNITLKIVPDDYVLNNARSQNNIFTPIVFATIFIFNEIFYEMIITLKFGKIFAGSIL